MISDWGVSVSDIFGRCGWRDFEYMRGGRLLQGEGRGRVFIVRSKRWRIILGDILYLESWVFFRRGEEGESTLLLF